MEAIQADVLHELGYEWWMFQNMAVILSGLDDVGHDPVRNALVESLVMHCRSLIDFFFKGGYEPRSTDWTSDKNLGIQRIDIVGYPVLSDWRENANKHVVHLTERRAIPVAVWHTGEVLKLLQERFESVRKEANVSPTGNWIGDWPVKSNLIESGIGQVSTSSTYSGPTGPARIR
ncbi:MAG: hypothetical protein IT345_02715 [Trueperaceae bacterium]|nr:hypothetical protein [Trueperaceae bacterium]